MEHVYPNLWDIDDNLSIFWLVSVLRIFSISVSLISIFSPILDRQAILRFTRAENCSSLCSVIKGIQLILHLLLSTSTVILKGLHKHK